MSVSPHIKNAEMVKEFLLKRKKELEEAIDLLQHNDGGDDQVQDPGDQANSAVYESLRNSLHNNEYEELKMIEKALEMIELGSYGMCVDCRQVISEKRLKLYPNATRCISCQEKAEEKSKRGESL